MKLRGLIRHLKITALVFFTVAGLALLPSCDGGGGLLAPYRTWVATEPVQCLGNPWERDWLERHGNDYEAYPRDPASQNAIVREYYARFGVDITDIVSIPKYQVVCAACSCPRGDTFYLYVRDRDVGTMLFLGYRREAPYRPQPGDTTLIGVYQYTGYDSTGSPLITGTLTFVCRETTSVSGTWALNGPAGYGPQVGMGTFVGEIHGNVVGLNLNPGWADNNVVLNGEMENGTYAGRWEWITFAGVTYTGNFTAVKRPSPPRTFLPVIR